MSAQESIDILGVSSCMFCEVYDHNGNKIQFQSQAEFEDYRLNRKNEVLVWEWRHDVYNPGAGTFNLR